MSDQQSRHYYRNSSGYLMTYDPEHPMAMSNGEVYIHRIIAYEHGLLSAGDKRQVHHIDRNRLNNDISNLQVLPLGEHQGVHRVLPHEEIADLYCQGNSIGWIADFFCTDAGTVSRILKKQGVAIRPRGESRKRTDIPIEEVLQRWMSGESVEEIAREKNCSFSFLYKFIRAHATEEQRHARKLSRYS